MKKPSVALFLTIFLCAGLAAVAQNLPPQMRRSADGRAQPLVIGDLQLDPLARRCRRGDTEVSLTTREYELLEALMRKPGQVVAKQDLLERVWGADFEGDPNVVEVYVGYLRRKIDRPFDRNDIETVRGVGYRIGSGADS